MADPKGPETGQGAKGGHSARPRPQTLDLSATDVSAKAAQAKPEAAKSDAPKSDAGKPEAPKTEAAKPSEPVKPADVAKPAEPAKAGAAAIPGAAPSRPAASTEPPVAKPAEPAKAGASAMPGAAASQSAASSTAGQSKPSESKPTDAKPSEAKPSDQKPAAAASAAAGAPSADPAKPAAAASASSSTPSSTPKTSATAASAASMAAAASARREGVGPIGVAAAAVGGAAIAVLVIALFGKELMGLGPTDASRVAATETKLDAVGRDVAALRAELAKTAQSADTGAIDGRLAELSKAIEASSSRVGGVEGELKTLSAKVSEPAQQDPEIAKLAGRIEGLELRLQNSPTAEALKGVASRVEGVEARIGDLPTKQTVAEVNANVSAMGQKVEAATGPLVARVDEVATALKERPIGDPAARLVVALGALDAALQSGRPFASEFAAVKAAAGGNAELDALGPHAAKGLPTREALGAELSATLGKLAPVKSEATGSIFDRFVANAGGVVKITPQNAGAGSDPASLRAQVAAQGAAGDLEGALAARGKLDEAARAATDDWAGRASALVSAETAIGSARTAALARLTAND